MKFTKNTFNITRKKSLPGYIKFITGGRSCVFIIPKIENSCFRCADVQFNFGAADSGICPVLRAFALENGCVIECSLIGSSKIVTLYNLALPYYEGKDFVCIKLESIDNTLNGSVVPYSANFEHHYEDALYFSCVDFYGSLPDRYTIIGMDTDSFKRKCMLVSEGAL